MIRLVRYGHEDSRPYDDYVLSNPEGTAYHLSAWMQAIEQGYGHPCWYLVHELKGRISGVLPLCQLRRPFGRHSLVSLPFCDLGGPLADHPDIAARLIDEARQCLASLSVKQVELRIQGEAMPVDRAESGEPGKVSMLAPLPPTDDELFTGFKTKLRSQIRKSSKNGLVFESGQSPAFVDAFYDVFAVNMKRLGSPVHSRQWFHAVCEGYQDRALVGLVKYGDVVAGAGIVLMHPNRASIPWASTRQEYNHLAPNMLLYWELLKLSCQAGCSVFDFGRSTVNEGTYRFKKQWGAQPYELHWRQYNSDGIDLSDERAPGWLSRTRPMVESAWQHLPTGMTTFLGPRIRRYISL